MKYLKFIKIIYIGTDQQLVSVLNKVFKKTIVLSNKNDVEAVKSELNAKKLEVDAILIDVQPWRTNNIIAFNNFKQLTADMPIIILMKPNDLIRLQDTRKFSNISACVPGSLKNIKYLLQIIQYTTSIYIKKQANNKIKQELAKRGRLVTGLIFGLIFDMDDKIVHANDYACSLLGYKEEELIGKTFLSSIFQAFDDHKDMKDKILSNKQWAGEIELFSANNDSIILKTIYTPELKNNKSHTYNMSGVVITNQVRKISETQDQIKKLILSHKKKENILQRRIKELEHLSEERYQKNIDIGNNALMLSLEKARNKIAEQTTQLYVYEDKIKNLNEQINKLQSKII